MKLALVRIGYILLDEYNLVFILKILWVYPIIELVWLKRFDYLARFILLLHFSLCSHGQWPTIRGSNGEKVLVSSKVHINKKLVLKFTS